ncbi:MAG: sulfatase-like hydrolase/transferase [Flavobacteriaceae bacterium]|nr:sulfatase-like hydrolase/transferase [Flavobacteriaceae bacterium]
MNTIFRLQEYKVLLYRIFLVYVFYFVARALFLFYNFSLLGVDSISEFFRLYYYGLAFDTTAILYVNSLFILLSITPVRGTTSKKFQIFLLYFYFVTNLIAYSLNFIDFIYYKYNYSRTTITVVDVLKDESNISGMLFRFLFTYWHVLVLFILAAYLWIYLYKKYKVTASNENINAKYYYLTSVLAIIIITVLSVGGIRGGDFKESTRPINLVDANRHVKEIKQADFVLNTPFAFIRTLSANTFKRVSYDISSDQIDHFISPIKHYTTNKKSSPNIVLIITESFSREYSGAFNKERNIKNYVSYTPFIDSLAAHSLIFTNAFANGNKSIHGMSSVLAGIPSFKDAFTSSPYSKQEIESVVSILNKFDYDTSFFHGAANGSMGFLGFGNILGFDNYYGRTEYNNDDDFDGTWGIWDEKFLDFTKKVLNEKKEPFFSTIFTLSSHEPYKIPKEYKGKFPTGNVQMNQSISYTDYSLKTFFEASKNEEWFNNTIFIITADHGSQTGFDEYRKTVNRTGIPILIYKPDNSLTEVKKELAQQIDIYPTIIDLIGYKKPFRSWGRSLINDTIIPPFTINFGASGYILQRGNYICFFDGEKATGFYDINDKDLKINLIEQSNSQMDTLEIVVKAFVKDFYDRIVDKNLGKPKK